MKVIEIEFLYGRDRKKRRAEPGYVSTEEQPHRFPPAEICREGA